METTEHFVVRSHSHRLCNNNIIYPAWSRVLMAFSRAESLLDSAEEPEPQAPVSHYSLFQTDSLPVHQSPRRDLGLAVWVSPAKVVAQA